MEYNLEEFNKCKIKAEEGDEKAICDLGYFYYYGCDGLESDVPRAVSCWKRAASMGDAVAQNSMAWAYKQGVGVEKDIHKFYEYKRMAANNGNKNAQFDIGEMYYY
ncbi:MAG: hypothetical protein NC393_00520 [Clostridium sp.]|nr:hypothetical protein [Clostridium sp.]MCM1207297.1 hypothetical protein [Ruminococcus sp.]